jgi:hypothetical protein
LEVHDPLGLPSCSSAFWLTVKLSAKAPGAAIANSRSAAAIAVARRRPCLRRPRAHARRAHRVRVKEGGMQELHRQPTESFRYQT